MIYEALLYFFLCEMCGLFFLVNSFSPLNITVYFFFHFLICIHTETITASHLLELHLQVYHVAGRKINSPVCSGM